MNKKLILLLLAFLYMAGVPVSSYSKDLTSGQVMRIAWNLMNNESFERAIEEYLKVVHLDKSEKYSARAEYMVGVCLQRNSKFWRAVKQWERVIEKYPATEWAKKSRDGIKNITLITEDVSRRPQYAVTLREKLVEMYIQFGEDFAARAWVYSGYKMELEKYEFETARYWYEKVINEYPDAFRAPYALERLGYLYYRSDLKKNFPKAIEQYQRMPELFSDNVLWTLRGLRLAADTIRDKGKKKDSVEVYEKIRDIAAKSIGENSFYKKYAETQLEVVK